jgi:hypothetical protein
MSRYNRERRSQIYMRRAITILSRWVWSRKEESLNFVARKNGSKDLHRLQQIERDNYLSAGVGSDRKESSNMQYMSQACSCRSQMSSSNKSLVAVLASSSWYFVALLASASLSSYLMSCETIYVNLFVNLNIFCMRAPCSCMTWTYLINISSSDLSLLCMCALRL